MMKEIPQSSHETWKNKFLIKTKALVNILSFSPHIHPMKRFYKLPKNRCLRIYSNTL